MKVTIRPTADPTREHDITRALISAIAYELSVLHGGNDELNWLEAERHLARVLPHGQDQQEAALPPSGACDTPAPPDPRRLLANDPPACPGCPRRRAARPGAIVSVAPLARIGLEKSGSRIA